MEARVVFVGVAVSWTETLARIEVQYHGDVLHENVIVNEERHYAPRAFVLHHATLFRFRSAVHVNSSVLFRADRQAFGGGVVAFGMSHNFVKLVVEGEVVVPWDDGLRFVLVVVARAVEGRPHSVANGP